MTSPAHTRRNRIIAGALAALTLSGGLFVAAAPAQSQSTSSCTGTVTVPFGPGTFGDQSATVFSSPNSNLGWVTSRTYSASFPAGRYDLTARSYDGYDGREYTDPAQPGERWAVEFLGAGGEVLATSAATPDLADGVPEASWTGSIGTVNLPQPAMQVRVVHASQGGDIPNSVSAVCLGALLQTPPTTTTTGPGLTLPPGIATEVQPEVVTPAPAAQAQTVQPSYTG